MKKCIPISQVSSRSRYGEISKGLYYFPLFENYRSKYNYSNIRESMTKWNSYSSNMNENVEKMLELFEIVNKKGNINEIEESVGIISRNLYMLNEFSWVKTQLADMDNAEPILQTIKEAEECDRVLNNHAKISNRFNIDEYVQSHSIGDEIEECIYELCSFIDTYNIGVNSKLKIALEEVQYALYTNGVSVSQETIMENVVDYFLMNKINEEDTNLEFLNIIENTIKNDKFCDNCHYIDYIKECVYDSNDKSLEESFVDTNKERINKIVTKFKSLPIKNPGSFRVAIDSLLATRSDEDIIVNSSSILSLAFYAIIITGAIAVNVWAGIAAAIVSAIVSNIAERSYLKRVITTWYANRDRASRKLDKCKDPEEKKKIEEYIKVLDKSIQKLEDEYDSMKSADEDPAETLRPADYTGTSTDGIDDLDFNLEGFGLEANNIATDIGAICDYLESISWDKDKVEDSLIKEDIFLNMKLEDADYITSFANQYPYMLDRDKLWQAMRESVRDLRKEPTLENYTRIGNFQINMKSLKEDATPKSVTSVSDMNSMYESVNSINEYVQAINELSVASHLKMAIDKFSKTISDLDAKQQVASRMVDSTCRRISRNIDRACTMDNREAVIRGDILPSTSKIIKLVVAGGALYLINPALALIAAIGKFAMDSRIKTKERQLVLNELDVELTMVDKYIEQAEEKKDMKKLRELLLLKKKLQSQYARLKYKIKIEWDDKDVVELRGKSED